MQDFWLLQPDTRLHLISMGALDEAGYLSYFGEGKWKLFVTSRKQI